MKSFTMKYTISNKTEQSALRRIDSCMSNIIDYEIIGCCCIDRLVKLRVDRVTFIFGLRQSDLRQTEVIIQNRGRPYFNVRGHPYALPATASSLTRNSFIMRCLFLFCLTYKVLISGSCLFVYLFYFISLFHLFDHSAACIHAFVMSYTHKKEKLILLYVYFRLRFSRLVDIYTVRSQSGGSQATRRSSSETSQTQGS